ncbi:hypothetical protein AB0H71_23115 [Nocardia sp. NPDC050697]|uniref:hypothetical protein n=1 Tax=Nocardia sp. NPDC050697 TaxID=3155158 RepID=UPI0033D6FBF6
MRPLDSGVIAPAAPEQLAHEALTATADPSRYAIQDVVLPQLPADLEPVEAPELVLSQRITDEPGHTSALPGGLPGLSGAGNDGAPDVLAGLPPEADALLGTANGVLDGANQLAQQATAALGAAVAPGASGVQRAAQDSGLLGGGDTGAAAAPLPALPADPVGALLNGLALPALPGVDLLMKPILDLLGSFGTGVLGALDPTAILSASSKVIDTAMQVAKGSLSTVDQLWQGQAARNAQVVGQQAQNQGTETSQRGIDISEITQRAAAAVQQGNAQLLGIASSLATQAVALAPVIVTPPAQATLMATATEHLGQAVAVANATRGDLAGKTAELTAAVNQLIAPGGGPAPQEVAQAVMQNIAEPIMSQAKDGVESATTAAGLDTSALPGSTPSTTPAAVTPSGTPSSTHGTPGIVPGSPTRSGTPGYSPGTPNGTVTPKAATPMPNAVVSPLRGVPGVPGTPLATGVPSSTATSSSGSSGFMGGAPGAAGAGQRGDDEHGRNVQPYQSRTGNDDLTGPLGESTPEVIGATHTDELFGTDYDQDQF